MIRDSARTSREMLSVRIPTYQYDRIRLYVAGARVNIQDFVVEALTDKLDKVDPVGRQRFERERAAAEAESPTAQLEERIVGRVLQALEPVLARVNPAPEERPVGAAGKRRHG
jgi:hypothetical protein